MKYGSTFILSRFAASVIYFLSLFFEQVSIDEKGIRFAKRVGNLKICTVYIIYCVFCLDKNKRRIGYVH
jgi:hypothetical protein